MFAKRSGDEEYPLLRTEQKLEKWDVFQDSPVKAQSESMVESKKINIGVKILKILAYLVTFTVVLGAAVISKGTLLFMTSQITPEQTRPYCNKHLGVNQQFVVSLPRIERVAWIWMLIFAFFVPELGTLIRSVRICLFKTWKLPTVWDFLVLLVTESLPTIGTAILVFCILPELDVVKGIMLTNAVCFVPAVVGFLSRNASSEDHPSRNRRIISNGIVLSLDIFSILAQTTALVVWPMVENKPKMWLIPVSVFCISFGWWENYVSEDSGIAFIKQLGKTKRKFENGRYFSYIFISAWKCALFLLTVLVIVWIEDGSVGFLFKEFKMAFKEHPINVTEIIPAIASQTDFDIDEVIQTGSSTILQSSNLTPVWVWLINIAATYTCYAFGKFACKIGIQSFSYAFPINLAVPLGISLLIALCGIYNGDECEFYDTIPGYLFFNSPPVYFLSDFIGNQHSWIWLLWLLSQTWITIHIWSPRCERLDRTEKLYVRPMYDAFLIDQSIALNRRRNDRPDRAEDFDDYESDDEIGDRPASAGKVSDDTTKIYVCATMWHETKDEIMEFLKSIMRLDEDQFAHEKCREYGLEMRDYYKVQTHIFFDDAFVREDEDDIDPELNEFVEQLVTAVNDAASEVHEKYIRLKPPKKYITPYGGRLKWILPGKTKMVAHLKDKKKIRAKKRWSQVMYMYYLLGHKLMEKKDISPARKDIIAENTYILALDGDIDFQPQALHHLVDLMKKNKTLGAACGRIHPVGSGPMVWYQKFEYAIGHWLQKATEHMIGCVLCSPGCFSLFRAKALMEEGVMKRYTTRSEQARQFVQYDQGEDRWLCTLLLQRGYRVEYSAASDAYTHCPEKFNEFYNQRRRWIPSTTANILDLLMDYKRTIKINDNISRPYILYQVVLMVGTILGPGTIFLMLVGAFVAAFQLDQWSSFFWNVVPILFFMVICFLCKSDVQLFFAGIISAIYGLVMMAVLVGVMLQISSDGVLAPSSLFFFCVAGEIIITALLHPNEIGCLPYGIVYYVTVPSMYMLLIIYSVFNLNNISWGTREVSVKPKKAEEPKEAKDDKDEEKKKKKPSTLQKLFGGDGKDKKSGSMEFSLAGLCTCMLCTHRKNPEEDVHLLKIDESLSKLNEKLERYTEQHAPPYTHDATDGKYHPRHRTTILEGSKANEINQYIDDAGIYNSSDQKSQVSNSTFTEPANSWVDQDFLGRGEYDSIKKPERKFWEGLLSRYLFPYEDDKDKVAADLKDLRDKAVMSFFMLNAIFVLVVFLLTLKKDLLHVNWPLDVKVNFTYHDDTREIRMYKQYLELEPIGFVFLFFFASLLVVQFVAMLFHRFGTFSQILATTYINWNPFKKMNKETVTETEVLESDPVKFMRQLIKIKGADEEDDAPKPEPAVGRRKTVKNLERMYEDQTNRQEINDLEQAFNRRRATVLNNSNDVSQKITARKSMMLALDKKVEEIQKQRRSVRFADEPNSVGYTNKGYENDVLN